MNSNKLKSILSTVTVLACGILMAASAGADTAAPAAVNRPTTSTTSTTSTTPVKATAQQLNQNMGNYIGKQVTLSGRIDRVLGNGSYIVADANHMKDPTHRILIFTASAAPMDKNAKQQAGTAAPTLKEGDNVTLNGKAQQFSISSETDSFAPKMNSETISETDTVTPLLVVQPGNIQKH